MIVHSCDSKDSVQPISTELGQTIALICPLKACRQSKYKFYHVTKNQTTVQSRLVHHGRYRFILNVSLENAGEYYCTEQCSTDTDQDEDKMCWFNITSKKLANC